MKKKLMSLLLVLALCLTPVAAAENENISQSGRVIAKALSYMGYTEGANESTIFGQRYGYPHGYWCDMFISWCGEEAGVPASIFPTNVNCSAHCRKFKDMGCFQTSAAYGGSYIPQQGDLVFFCYTTTKAIHHIALVLYVENGLLYTVEGNTLTSRLDHSAAEVSALRKGSIEPLDYVTCNIYTLNDPRLYGYAVPNYTSREPLDLEGYVDLGPYAGLQSQLDALADAGIMTGTSSHTYSPRGGLTRGDFLKAVLTLFNISGWDDSTAPFADVPASSPYYETAMTARSVGFVYGDGNNRLNPEIYISGPAAQQILSRALALIGWEDRTFSFGNGDFAYLLEPYTTRIDIAQALYALWEDFLITEPYSGTIVLGDSALDWTARSLNGACYLPLPQVLQRFEGLTVSSGTGGIKADGTAPAGNENDGQSVRATVSLDYYGRVATMNAFIHDGISYVPMDSMSALLFMEIQAVPLDETVMADPDEATEADPDETVETDPEEAAEAGLDETAETDPEETTEAGLEEAAEFVSQETAELDFEETAEFVSQETAELDFEETAAFVLRETAEPFLEEMESVG